MTHLRQMMLDELQRRNYSDGTARGYLSAVAALLSSFGKPPDQLGPDDLRRYQAYLLKKRKLGVNTVIGDECDFPDFRMLFQWFLRRAMRP